MIQVGIYMFSMPLGGSFYLWEAGGELIFHTQMVIVESPTLANSTFT